MSEHNNWLIAGDWLFSGVLTDGHMRVVVTNLETNIQVYDEPAHQAVRDLLAGKVLRDAVARRVLLTECLKEQNKATREGRDERQSAEKVPLITPAE